MSDEKKQPTQLELDIETARKRIRGDDAIEVIEHVIKLYGSELEKANELIAAQRQQIDADAKMIEELRQLIALQSRISLLQFIADNGVQLWPNRNTAQGAPVNWTAQSVTPFLQVTAPTVQRALVNLRNKLIELGAVKPATQPEAP